MQICMILHLFGYNICVSENFLYYVICYILLFLYCIKHVDFCKKKKKYIYIYIILFPSIIDENAGIRGEAGLK